MVSVSRSFVNGVGSCGTEPPNTDDPLVAEVSVVEVEVSGSTSIWGADASGMSPIETCDLDLNVVSWESVSLISPIHIGYEGTPSDMI